MNRIIRTVVLVAFSVVGLVGCGGGSDGGSTHESLIGQYECIGFDIKYKDGSIYETEADYPGTWHGFAEFGPTKATYEWFWDGGYILPESDYSVSWTSNTEGFITFTNSFGSNTHPFTLNNGLFTLIFVDQRIISFDPITTGDSYVYYQKISDTSGLP